MTEEQRMGELHADEIYTETWDWLKARNCAHLINPILLQEYAMATARWIQIEGVTSQYGFISKHPTTGMPSQSPFVAEAQSYLKLSNTLWLQIDQIVKENCSVEYGGANPHDDLMERLLSARKPSICKQRFTKPTIRGLKSLAATLTEQFLITVKNQSLKYLCSEAISQETQLSLQML